MLAIDAPLAGLAVGDRICELIRLRSEIFFEFQAIFVAPRWMTERPPLYHELDHKD